MAILKLPVFWSSRKLTSLRGQVLQPSPLSPSFTHYLPCSGGKLHSNAPSTTTKPTLLHTCAASALLNDAPPALLVFVVAEGGGGGGRFKSVAQDDCQSVTLGEQDL
jgi:hypothetical protein